MQAYGELCLVLVEGVET
uniref:Uncharacterized protein n=1 Tax=Rhizophora mucronata TaxID=61149 RepID=A0A2P2QYY7_RHIMU